MHAAVVAARVQRDAEQHHLHAEDGRDPEPMDAGAALRLDRRFLRLRGVGGRAVTRPGEGFEQAVHAGNARIEANLRAPEGKVDGGGEDAGRLAEQTLDQPRAPRATHPLHGEGDVRHPRAAGAHVGCRYRRHPPRIDLRAKAGGRWSTLPRHRGARAARTRNRGRRRKWSRPRSGTGHRRPGPPALPPRPRSGGGRGGRRSGGSRPCPQSVLRSLVGGLRSMAGSLPPRFRLMAARRVCARLERRQPSWLVAVHVVGGEAPVERHQDVVQARALPVGEIREGDGLPAALPAALPEEHDLVTDRGGRARRRGRG